MGIPYNQFNTITEGDMKRAKQPFFITLTPVAPVAAGAVAIFTVQTPDRDFLWTSFGFSSTPAGLPLAGQPFRLGLRDNSTMTWFQDQRFDLASVTGSDQTISQSGLTWLSCPWPFFRKSTINVELQNVGALAATPIVTLHGYLMETTKEVR